MITYSTNWMGPAGMWWFRENGHTRMITRVLEEDSRVTSAKKGDTVTQEEITEYWYGGRIDVYGTDDPYGVELGLPIMDGPSYKGFSEWLEKFETETVWSLEQLVEEYEKSHDKIRWHDERTNSRTC